MKEHLKALALLLVVGAALWYFFAPGEVLPPQAFYGEGNLVKNNPGLTPDVWYLVYEEPGFPGLSVPLSFDANSQCELEGKTSRCNLSFLQGDRVKITGGRVGDGVLVEKLVFAAPTERGVPVHLFYYDKKKDTDTGGNMLCSEKSLTYVERVLPSTATPLADTLRLLLRGDISEEEKAKGVSSEFPLIRVRLESATIQNGTATLTFSDPDHKTSGGACRATLLRAQVEATARQFPEVKEVRIVPEDIFQP